MKKTIVLILLLLIVCACDRNDKHVVNDSESLFSRIDDNKGYIYLDDYTTYKLGDISFEQKLPVINFNNDDSKNVNLELKSRVAINKKKALFNDDVVSKVLVDEYEIVETDKSISLIDREYYYINQEKSIINVYVYVFNKKDMKLYDNESLLSKFNITQDDLFDRLESMFNDDELYNLMMIKNNGYKLYIDNDGNLVLLSVVTNDDESELIKVVITE